MAGSHACVKARAEVETGLLVQNQESVSPSSVSLSLLGEGDASRPIAVALNGLRFETADNRLLIALTDEDWSRVLPVSVIPPESSRLGPLPSITGHYSRRGEQMIFEPLYGFDPGVDYLAEFKATTLSLRLKRHGEALPERLRSAGDLKMPFSFEARESEGGARVLEVFPSAAVLPENLLKFYIHFSHPMSLGTDYQHIHLLRKDGSEVAAPFLQLDEELWDPEGIRMTVLIDPGRIKSGLLPRGEVGSALKTGESFRLVIDSEWPDERGRPLLERFEKGFQVRDPDVESPKMSLWKLHVPQASTREAFLVSFPEALDHALLNRVVWLIDSRGAEIEGSILIEQGELGWSFVPRDPWQPGIYQLCAENSLEDIAGNSLGRPFEVDSFLTVSRRVERETIKRVFQIR